MSDHRESPGFSRGEEVKYGGGTSSMAWWRATLRRICVPFLREKEKGRVWAGMIGVPAVGVVGRVGYAIGHTAMNGFPPRFILSTAWAAVWAREAVR